MICNNFTDHWYRVILSQYLNNFYTEFLPITDKIGVKLRERGKYIKISLLSRDRSKQFFKFNMLDITLKLR